MAKNEHIKIEVKEDFLARQTRAEPAQALSELIWNSLDAEATEINVEFAHNDLAGGLSKIVVYDNGSGFSRMDALVHFGNLGGSWKRVSRITPNKKRMIHGQEGRGRYKAFALGKSAEWKVCYLDKGKPKAYTITLLESDLTDVIISEEVDAVGQKPGVIVEINDMKRDFKSLTSEAGTQIITEIFAIYLIHYKDVKISISGVLINPEQAIAEKQEITMPEIEVDGKKYPFALNIIEWKRETSKTLYLCTEQGFPLSQVETKFHTGAFTFSAYLKSPLITALNNDNKLALSEMQPVMQGVIDIARGHIKEIFRKKAAARARNVVEEWKAEHIYPYEGEARGPLEEAERQVFDIVAVSVQDLAPDLENATAKTKALHLRLLRSAIEQAPSELQMILNEVLNLGTKKQKELAELLEETTLASVITAAKTVSERLKFITALENLVFDPETKNLLKERSQLHKIVAENTWIFGEEYNLWVSDKDLKRVLEKHKELLDPSIVIDDPVKVVGKVRGIIDLMLSRAARRHRANDIEHLVVELKAPKVVIGSDEITQIKKYAHAISNDERFSTVKGIRWHFWVVSNNYDDYAREEIEGGPDADRRLIYRKNAISVGIKTWGEIIEENRARLQFFQESLQHTADTSQAMKYLQERHKQFLVGVLDEDESPNVTAEQGIS